MARVERNPILNHLFQVLISFAKTDGAWFSFLRPHDWEILVMEALLHVPGKDEKEQTFRISVSDKPPPPTTTPVCTTCTVPRSQPEENSERK